MRYETKETPQEIQQIFFEQVKKGLQPTSLEAYNKILPTISDKQGEVLQVLRHLKEVSNMEIAAALDWSINRVTPRIKELRDIGVVETAGLRNCKITGEIVNIWRMKDGFTKD